MKVQALEKLVDGLRMPAITINAVEDILGGLHRQHRDLWAFAIPGDCCDTGGDTDTYGFKLTQFIHHCVDLFVIWPLWVEDGLGIVEDYEHLLGGKEGSEGRYILGVLDSRTDDLGETGQEMRARNRELIAADEPTVTTEQFLDATVVENGTSNGCLSDPPCTDQGNRLEVFCNFDDLLDQLLTSKKTLWRRGRRFTI